MAAKPTIGRAEALRLAMRDLLADPSDAAWAHPQVWAPFVVVGEAGGTSAGAAVTNVRVGTDGVSGGTRGPRERTAAPARSSRPTAGNAQQPRADPPAATPSADDDWRRRVFGQD